jgi:hypothetical protein
LARNLKEGLFSRSVAQIAKGTGNLVHSADMASCGIGSNWGRKRMKRLAFVLCGAAALSLAACSGNNEDALQNAEVNQPNTDELNQLSNQAAMDAANAEAEALGTQQKQLENENAGAVDDTTNPTDADEQNVSGM